MRRTLVSISPASTSVIGQCSDGVFHTPAEALVLTHLILLFRYLVVLYYQATKAWKRMDTEKVRISSILSADCHEFLAKIDYKRVPRRHCSSFQAKEKLEEVKERYGIGGDLEREKEKQLGYTPRRQ